MSGITIRHNPERERFEVLDDGRVIGKAAYKPYSADPGQRIFYHTVVDEAYGGQGLANKLAVQALDETIREGLGIVPVCPFIKKFLAKHPEYDASRVAVTAAHLESLDAALDQRSRA
jgi:predicted GNAT family acetyltransferase